MHRNKGRVPRAPLQGAQRTPSHCPPDGRCHFQWHLQPIVTAPNRFDNLLQPPIQPLLGPPLRSLPFYCMHGQGGAGQEAAAVSQWQTAEEGVVPGDQRRCTGCSCCCRAVRKAHTKRFITPTETNVHGDALCVMVKTWAKHKTTETVLNSGWRLAVGGWRLAVGGGWRLVVPGGCP